MLPRRLSFLIITGMLVFGSVGVMISLDDSVDAVGAPAIRIELHQTKVTAYVAPGQDGVVNFTGTVYAQVPWCPEIQYLIVSLIADAGGWATSTPPPLVFSKSITELDFEITVQVPPMTSYMIQGLLSVSGRWNYSPGAMGGSVEEATGLIHIAQYFVCDLETTTPVLEAERGGYAEFMVDVINNGNGYDEMIIEIENQNDLIDRDINIQMAEKVIVVPEERTVGISIRATVNEGASIGEYTISISGRSKLAEDLDEPCDTDYLDLYINVVREIEEPEEDPEEIPDEDQGDPDGDSGEEIAEDIPEITPGERTLPSLGLIGLVFSLISIAFVLRKTRKK